DHARVHAEAARRAERLRALAEIEELVSGSLDLDEVLRRIAQVTTRLVDAPAVHVWTADVATRTLHRRASSVESPAVAEKLVDTPDVMQRIASAAASMRPGALGSVHSLDTDNMMVRYAAEAGRHWDGLPAAIPFGTGLPGLVAQRGAPLLVTDPASFPATLA